MSSPGESSETALERTDRVDTISVVYVDDYGELCDLTAEGLEEASDRLTVRTTTDPTTVPDRVGEFDCIVADYDMPELDGLGLLRRVRAVDGDVPFILYTGKGDEDVASEAISLGVTDYLTKRGGPERFTRLANRIEGVVRTYRAVQTVERTRREARETLQRERARFRALVEHSLAATVVLASTGRIEYCSPAVEEITGFRPGELRGEFVFEYVHDDDRAALVEAIQRSIGDPEYRPTVEYRFRHAGGEWRHLESTGIDRLEVPAIEGFVLNTHDVTARRRAGERLNREAGIAERLFEVSEYPLFVVGDSGAILRANEMTARLFDASESRLIERSPSAFDVTLRNSGDGETPTEERLGAVARASGHRVEGVTYEISVPAGRLLVRVDAAPLSAGEGGDVALGVDAARAVSVGGDNNT